MCIQVERLCEGQIGRMRYSVFKLCYLRRDAHVTTHSDSLYYEILQSPDSKSLSWLSIWTDSNCESLTQMYPAVMIGCSFSLWFCSSQLCLMMLIYTIDCPSTVINEVYQSIECPQSIIPPQQVCTDVTVEKRSIASYCLFHMLSLPWIHQLRQHFSVINSQIGMLAPIIPFSSLS